jgi:carbon storage regulator
MLVLTRRVGEEIAIGRDIRVAVLRVNGERVRLGVTAPELVRVDRLEIHQRRAEFANGPPSVSRNRSRTGQASAN